MSRGKRKNIVIVHDTGLTKLTEQERKTIEAMDPHSEEVIFKRLDDFLVSRIKDGEHDPRWLIKQLVSLLHPEEIRVLLENPENRGMYTPNKQHARNLMCIAVWHAEAENIALLLKTSPIMS